MTHLPCNVLSPRCHKRRGLRGICLQKTILVRPFPLGRCVTLANENVDREIRRATIPYSPLYPTFQDRLNAFRQGEHAELLQRGAERVINNVGLYDSRRSSEDRSVDAAVFRPADTALPGPLEDSVEQEEQAPQAEEPPPRADLADGNRNLSLLLGRRFDRCTESENDGHVVRQGMPTPGWRSRLKRSITQEGRPEEAGFAGARRRKAEKSCFWRKRLATGCTNSTACSVFLIHHCKQGGAKMPTHTSVLNAMCVSGFNCSKDKDAIASFHSIRMLLDKVDAH